MTPTCTWLLTWTTYGAWLPGDARGFVSPFRTETGEQLLINTYGTEPAAGMPRLHGYARSVMTEEPVLLSLPQAGAVALQFRETAAVRGWHIAALAIMANHVHLVVTAPAEVDSGKLIGDLKAYATRRLNREFGCRRWWTERGSGRALSNEAAIERATRYVLAQEQPLMIWSAAQPP